METFNYLKRERWVAGNWSMVAMYIAWTANCIYGWWNWTKLNKKAEVVNV